MSTKIMRLYCPETGTMIEGVDVLGISIPAGEWHKWTIDQWTGITDINGQYIYENDIVRWGTGSACLDGKKYKLYRGGVVSWDWFGLTIGVHEPVDRVSSLEKMGDLYEHSHLLERDSNEALTKLLSREYTKVEVEL